MHSANLKLYFPCFQSDFWQKMQYNWRKLLLRVYIPFNTCMNQAMARLQIRAVATSPPQQSAMIILLTLLVGEARLAAEPSKGLLIVGGWCDGVSTELWGPDGTQCMLPDLSSRSQTLNVLQNRVIACYDKSCDELTDIGWVHAQDLLHQRYFYTSIVTTDGMLLIGGAAVNGGNETEELIPINQGPNQPAFSLEWWKYTDGSICSIKINDTSLVLTGGDRSHSESMVTELSKIGTWKNVGFKDLPKLNSGRAKHACGSYWLNDVQILIVAGGQQRSSTKQY